MGLPDEDPDDDPRATDLLRGAARWAWERDEVERRVTTRKLLYTVALYGMAFVLSLGFGGALWLAGREVQAITFWLVANGLTGFFGAIAVSWEVLELLYERRDPDRVAEPDPGPERELAPDLSVSRDAKISFVVTVLVLLLLSAAVYAASALL